MAVFGRTHSLWAASAGYAVCRVQDTRRHSLVKAMNPPDGALVIGASSGIGRAAALRLATYGVPLTLAARSRTALEEVAQECRAAGAAVEVEPLDVRDEVGVSRVVAKTVAAHGRRVAVVHTPAVLAYGLFEQVPRDVTDSVLEIGLGGAVRVARCAMREFRTVGGGHLVLVGSLLGDLVAPYLGSYAIAKWGVHALARTLQIESRDRENTHVSLVAPAGTETPIYRHSATLIGRYGRALPPARTADDVAIDIMRVLAHPRRKVTAGLVHHVATTAYRVLPALYDAAVTPLSRTLALDAWRGTPATLGNVHSTLHLPPSTEEEGPSMKDPSALEKSSLRRPHVSRSVAAPAQAVWDVLSDGWLYATWVVGASRVRQVDLDWPAPASRLHHSVGLWPAVLSDSTVVEEAEPPHRLVLRARGWPLGEALVEITVVPDGAGDCTVTIAEDADDGPGKLVPMPVRQLGILPRNHEALRRLALIAEGRHREAISPGGRAPTQS